MKPVRAPLLTGAAVTAVSLGVYGAARFIFNIIALRVFGAAFVGEVASRISMLSIGAVLVGAPLATTIVRFVATRLELNQQEEAASLATAGVVGACCATPILLVVALASNNWSGEFTLLLLYAPLFLFYQVIRGCYLAASMSLRILTGELIGTAGFLVVLVAGIMLGRPAVVAASLVVQPCGLLSMSVFRPPMAWRTSGLGNTLRENALSLGMFAGGALAVSALGVASYHVVVVFSRMVVGDAAKVGVLAVCLSALSPLGLLPAAVGMVLMPAQARRAVVGDVPTQRALVANPVCALQVAIAPLVGLLIIGTPEILSTLRLPIERPVGFIWIASCLATFVSAASTPAGNYLNGTGRLKEQVILSLASLAIAILGGWVALLRLGIAGGGVMLFLATAFPSWIRLWLAARSLRWTDGVQLPFWTGHLYPWAATLSTVLVRPWQLRVLAWFVLAILLLPSAKLVQSSIAEYRTGDAD